MGNRHFCCFDWPTDVLSNQAILLRTSVTSFGEISALWQKNKNLFKLFRVHLAFGKILIRLWQIFYALGQVFIVVGICPNILKQFINLVTLLRTKSSQSSNRVVNSVSRVFVPYYRGDTNDWTLTLIASWTKGYQSTPLWLFIKKTGLPTTTSFDKT